MPRAIWSGSISFGLVNVPVRLFAAVDRKEIHFHQLDGRSGARIRYKKVSERTGREVDADQIVRGYEISDGHYVPVTDEELEAAEPERSHTITVEDFVAWDEIDPMHFESTYWVVPDDAKGAKQAYALLRDAMTQAARVAVGRFVMRTKEHLVVLRPVEGAIALHGMLFPDEIVAPKNVEGLPVRVEAADRQVEMAQKLIDSLTVDWDPKRYRDTHRAALEKVIARKAKGEEIVVEPQAEQAEPMKDLLAALEASLAGSSGSSGSAARRRPRRAAASRKRSSTSAAGGSSSGKRRTSRNRKS